MVKDVYDWVERAVRDSVERAAFDQMRRRAEAIEIACEEAVQGGTCGVLVDEVACTARPHPYVPYGEMIVINRHPTLFDQEPGRW